MTEPRQTQIRDWFVVLAFFAILTILTLVTIIYAKEAEQEAREVRRELRELNVSAQNRCLALTVLSYPPPITEAQYDLVIGDFDRCIKERPVREIGQGGKP
jgi:hypothetical protein